MAARRETAIGEQPLRGALRLQAFLEDGMRIERGLARCGVRGERETRVIVLELEDHSFPTPDRHIHRPLTDRGTDTGINRLIRRHTPGRSARPPNRSAREVSLPVPLELSPMSCDMTDAKEAT